MASSSRRLMCPTRTARPSRPRSIRSTRTGKSWDFIMITRALRTRSSRLDVKLALEIATQVASGLAAVHEQHVVHRDIKPSNIMVRRKEEGTVTAKIIDLGLAKPAADAPTDAAISIPGIFAGTPEFASPEQFGGVGVDIRSDL